MARTGRAWLEKRQMGYKGLKMINQEYLKSKLIFDIKTGIFTWKQSHKKIKVGDIAGCVRKKYIHIKIDSKPYLAHRLAWLYVYGKFPDNYIDHIDGNPSNNKLENLRDVSQKINNENRIRSQKNNLLGVMGVCAHGNRFRAKIGNNKKIIHIGIYHTLEEAKQAYLTAKRILHTGCTI